MRAPFWHDRRRHECRRGTHECVRHLSVWLIVVTAAAAPAIDFDRISADSLRTNITWLAADERSGRMTPSPGLDASADYLGAQFRLAGLEPGAADGSFFQIAAFTRITPELENFRMTLEAGTRRLSL